MMKFDEICFFKKLELFLCWKNLTIYKIDMNHTGRHLEFIPILKHSLLDS